MYQTPPLFSYIQKDRGVWGRGYFDLQGALDLLSPLCDFTHRALQIFSMQDGKTGTGPGDKVSYMCVIGIHIPKDLFPLPASCSYSQLH